MACEEAQRKYVPLLRRKRLNGPAYGAFRFSLDELIERRGSSALELFAFHILAGSNSSLFFQRHIVRYPGQKRLEAPLAMPDHALEQPYERLLRKVVGGIPRPCHARSHSDQRSVVSLEQDAP